MATVLAESQDVKVKEDARALLTEMDAKPDRGQGLIFMKKAVNYLQG